MFIDEGDVFTEILEFVETLKKQWNLDIVIAKNTDVTGRVKKIDDIIKVKDLNESNRQELRNLNFKDDEFTFEPESYIGNHLMKTVPMKTFIQESMICSVGNSYSMG